MLANLQMWLTALGVFGAVGLYVAARFVWAALKTFASFMLTLLKIAVIVGLVGFVVGGVLVQRIMAG